MSQLCVGTNGVAHRQAPRRPQATRRSSGVGGSGLGKPCVLVFTRSPEPGRVKTRLMSALDAEGAAAVHGELVEHTLDVVSELCQATATDGVVRVAGAIADLPSASRHTDLRMLPQHDGDLGDRLDRAVREAFDEGARSVLVIGTDCPDLTAGRLAEAAAVLERADVVLGPAMDGGYYLIGMRQYRPGLFQGMAWGTETVLRQTLAAARQLRLRTRLLPPLSDIDYPEDLVVWRRLGGSIPGRGAGVQQGMISIVIPAINEAVRIGETLRPLMDRDDIEVIVVDGGSTDGTVAMARGMGARVITTRAGRARQMNAGAAVASGERLLFLHADTTLPKGFAEVVHTILDGGSVAGAFRLRIDSHRPGLRVVEWGADIRSHYLQLPYGDQGLFLDAATFYRNGGFRDVPLMEDYEFCRRLRGIGRITLAPLAISTSARRWHSLGVVWTTLVNQLCIAGFLAGVPPAVLARLYSRRSGRP